MSLSKDFDIRSGVVRHLIATGTPRNHIRHELTLDSNSYGGRTDIVVIADAALIGIEIKSCKDKLDRLEEQTRGYTQSLDQMIIVVGKKHLPIMREKYWGHRVAICDHDAGVILDVYGVERKESLLGVGYGRYDSHFTSVAQMACLLWRDDVVAVAAHFGMKFKTRYDAIGWLRDHVTLKQMREQVVLALRRRDLSKYEMTFWERYDALGKSIG